MIYIVSYIAIVTMPWLPRPICIETRAWVLYLFVSYQYQIGYSPTQMDLTCDPDTARGLAF